MFRGAIVGERELALLRRIEDVVRMGRVQRIERDRIVLDQGSVPTDEEAVHVHCSASALVRPTPRPMFEARRVTLQPFLWSFACYQYAMLAVIEATLDSDDEKNALCKPIRYWDNTTDYLTAYLAAISSGVAVAAHPKLASWVKTTRLNPASGINAHRDDPRVSAARERIKSCAMAAAINLQKLLADRSTAT
jgi:hypothetical protein